MGDINPVSSNILENEKNTVDDLQQKMNENNNFEQDEKKNQDFFLENILDITDHNKSDFSLDLELELPPYEQNLNYNPNNNNINNIQQFDEESQFLIMVKKKFFFSMIPIKKNKKTIIPKKKYKEKHLKSF